MNLHKEYIIQLFMIISQKLPFRKIDIKNLNYNLFNTKNIYYENNINKYGR